jgi:hypothetical protein
MARRRSLQPSAPDARGARADHAALIPPGARRRLLHRSLLARRAWPPDTRLAPHPTGAVTLTPPRPAGAVRLAAAPPTGAVTLALDQRVRAVAPDERRRARQPRLAGAGRQWSDALLAKPGGAAQRTDHLVVCPNGAFSTETRIESRSAGGPGGLTPAEPRRLGAGRSKPTARAAEPRSGQAATEQRQPSRRATVEQTLMARAAHGRRGWSAGWLEGLPGSPEVPQRAAPRNAFAETNSPAGQAARRPRNRC